MRPSDLFFTLFRFFIPPAIIASLYLYLYPILHDCSFPEAKPAEAACLIPGQQRAAVAAQIAPFRLLALGDPQLEGDTSLPDPDAAAFPSLEEFEARVRDEGLSAITGAFKTTVKKLFSQDVPKLFDGYRKRLDLWGNDLYLAHIYRSVYWWAQPTHTVVLGDLLGSQWIGDEEFKKRSDRFWRVFNHGVKVPRTVTDVSGRAEVLGSDGSWERRIIAVAGNHDIGYAGDIDEHRISRFENSYGSVNWDIHFKINRTTSGHAKASFLMQNDPSPLEPISPELHLIVANSMNLDEPAYDHELQKQSRDFLTDKLYGPAARASRTTATVLLTHIPFHKDENICADGPFFDYFPPDQGGGIKEQNHLSKSTSEFILNGILRHQRQSKAIVLNGHDHEGCDTYHHISRMALDPDENDAPIAWAAERYHLARPLIANQSLAGLREITVRSMMGSFGGNAGLLSGWFDHDMEEWKFEYSTCALGVQHIWWAVHVLDLIATGLGLIGILTWVWEEWSVGREAAARKKMKKA